MTPNPRFGRSRRFRPVPGRVHRLTLPLSPADGAVMGCRAFYHEVWTGHGRPQKVLCLNQDGSSAPCPACQWGRSREFTAILTMVEWHADHVGVFNVAASWTRKTWTIPSWNPRLSQFLALRAPGRDCMDIFVRGLDDAGRHFELAPCPDQFFDALSAARRTKLINALRKADLSASLTWSLGTVWTAAQMDEWLNRMNGPIEGPRRST